jgi:hypothetical protein
VLLSKDIIVFLTSICYFLQEYVAFADSLPIASLHIYLYVA